MNTMLHVLQKFNHPEAELCRFLTVVIVKYEFPSMPSHSTNTHIYSTGIEYAARILTYVPLISGAV